MTRGGIGCTQSCQSRSGSKTCVVMDKHLTLEQLAEQTGLSKSALGKYETDDYKDISPFAIATLANFYGVSTDYLMGLTENREVPNADVQSLHLTDEMIDLLRSGKSTTGFSVNWLPIRTSGG